MPSNQCPIILGAGLYTTYRGERVLVVIGFNATFLFLRPRMTHLDAVRLFTFFLIPWTLQSHFISRLNSRTLGFVWGRVQALTRVGFSVIGVGASKFLGVRRTFGWISPNLPEKFLFNFCLQIFSHKDHENLFLVWFSKKKRAFMCFSAQVGRYFLKSSDVECHFSQILSILPRFSEILSKCSGILPEFSEIFPRFSTNENFWGWPSAPPPLTPLLNVLLWM